ncbi:phage integrase SAM-like domain and Arm DNA-binding domain-containing protein [Mucilaginibacter sp. R-33]|uniref:phage integrase SAM-like domain and Arm DNA-binding domain-containing protein n=1 Tax=Mucilaginibacter sp. R-33 TaxID=3416711 RepID=UPI003CED7F7A
MGISLRTQKLTKGRVRLSLDIYSNGKSHYENLKLFLYEKPVTSNEREHNKRTKNLADTILAKRLIEMQEGNYNVVTGFKSQASFIKYFKQLTNERKGSGGNFGNWDSTYKHLLSFAKGQDVTFAQVNEEFLNKFKKYLLSGKVTKGNQDLSSCSASSYLNKVKAALNWAFRRYVTPYSVAKLTTCLLAKKCSSCFSSINKDNYLPISI